MKEWGAYEIQFIPKVKEIPGKSMTEKFGLLQLQSVNPVYLGLSLEPIFAHLCGVVFISIISVLITFGEERKFSCIVLLPKYKLTSIR